MRRRSFGMWRRERDLPRCRSCGSTPGRLSHCAAYIYVRQSTAYQVVNNLESQRRQYGLVERARQLGWDDVQLVDDDLGRSGGGTARPGFEKLLAAICEGRVGAVVSLEASRLARNGRDWHTLLEFCGLVGTLIVDEEAIYDPRSPNDRLLLGMKGTMSEMELSVFRQRSIEAMRQKARRGELHLTVAVGYVKTDDNRIEKDPDRRCSSCRSPSFLTHQRQLRGRPRPLQLRQPFRDRQNPLRQPHPRHARSGRAGAAASGVRRDHRATQANRRPATDKRIKIENCWSDLKRFDSVTVFGGPARWQVSSSNAYLLSGVISILFGSSCCKTR